jgi:ubiquinone/menaquinone biosynthesis C-methylase UbiE
MDPYQHEAMELKSLLRSYKQNVRKIWEIRSKHVYSVWKNEKGDFYSIGECLNVLKPSELLDIGFGYGRLAPLYKEISFVVGMDISRTMLALAFEHGINITNIITVLGDIRCLPFANSSFSCVISIRTLNHIHPDDFYVVEHEITRVCREAVILLESDVKVPGTDYEFEHDYDRFLHKDFRQTKKQLQEHVFLRTYLRRKV